ncbi:MAG: hypothetical protein FWC92_02685 [Defluviitaleaceae bacterium]|nr:hypothetical protein [Defluviitaleaceae bacterium]
MLNYEETQEALDNLIQALPSGIYKGLNCGVILLPDVMYDVNDLLILGQYHVEPYGLGRYVTIHHGSLAIAYGHLHAEAFVDRLRHTLHHELTHHLESLAGDRSLEVEDAQNIAKILADRHYMSNSNPNSGACC